MILLRPMYTTDNDIVTPGVQNVSVVHPHCPECKRVMLLQHPMYVKYNDIMAPGVQNASVVHSQCPES